MNKICVHEYYGTEMFEQDAKLMVRDGYRIHSWHMAVERFSDGEDVDNGILFVVLFEKETSCATET